MDRDRIGTGIGSGIGIGIGTEIWTVSVTSFHCYL
jgi:hypothetical protein